ncbi:MAG: hypothetical protein K940chlam2_00602 [Chlamydiae bacterium]|nr:hypothetical protein [Chlamydiota bacterium]
MAISFPRAIMYGSIALFSAIAAAALIKKNAAQVPVAFNESASPLKSADGFPHADRMNDLFHSEKSKLPFVERVTYSPSVPWLKGRPAWIADYAAHYATASHFIARSLKGPSNYLSMAVTEGDTFNVLTKDRPLEFYLAVDTSRCMMAVYCYDADAKKRYLLKSYRVGLGRRDLDSPSGCLTPLGRFQLGKNAAVYKPGAMGQYNDQKVELIQIFGTRWIPFGETISGTASPKGYGIQGAPFVRDKGKILEQDELIGKYASEGSICLSREDLEELFAVITSRPAYVEVVTDINHAQLPGIEE